jgi:hypothetical protein
MKSTVLAKNGGGASFNNSVCGGGSPHTAHVNGGGGFTEKRSKM